MEFDLHSKIVVFIVDDEKNARWVQEAVHALTKSCNDWTIEVLDQSALGQLQDGNAIIKCFASRIVDVASSGNVDSVFVVTDSTFGTNPEIRSAGFQLLHDCSNTLNKLFKCGVVYSTAPHGNSQRNRIELMYRTRDRSADFLEISTFFKSGCFLSPSPIIEIVNSLSCILLIKGQMEAPVIGRLYRPMTSYGVPSDERGHYITDPAVNSVNSVSRPFVPDSIRYFRIDALRILVNSYAECSGNDVSVSKLEIDFVRDVLCPYHSMFSAVNSWYRLTPDFGCGSGALRLVWDLAMSGNNSDILRRDYFGSLKKAHHDPSSIAGTLDKYLKVMAHFANDNDGSMFGMLLNAALLEWHRVDKIIRAIRT